MKRLNKRALKQVRFLIASLGFSVLPPAVVAGQEEQAVRTAFAAQARYLAEQGLTYEHGEGVPRDQKHAARLYCESARLGDAEGMYALGWMYANGRGVERNDAYAGTLFAMAAQLGHVHAERMLRFTGEYTGAVPECMHTPTETVLEHWPVEGVVAGMAPARREIAQLLVKLAPQYGIQPQFALAIGMTESNLNPGAVSPKSAMGVMQLIPETAERFNVRNPYDPEQNIRGGLAYLRWLLAYFRGDIALAAAGYNAGEGAVDRYRGVPPFRETQGYVERILAFVRSRHHPYDERIVAPSVAVSGLRTSAQGAGES
ncbi:MAG: transglycosylase SLT domain-containing protein [Proteobacteria bacterium]|nr:transglycosylase SLT domain-containing protein [Pseudomonadota bacterium]